MDDLISRLSEMRSNYNCFNETEEPYYRALSEAIQLASAQPEIIRCKECKHRDPEDKKCDSGHFILWQLPRDDDWFCADGERRTDERVMGVDVIESRNRTARKPHRCDYCGEIIEKGEEYSYQKNIFDGTFYEWHTHLACSRVASAIWDYCDPDDGMSDQDFTDGCQEVCQRFICPDCPKWNKEYGDCDDDITYCIDKMDEFFKTYELYKAGREGYYEVWKCREIRRVE